MSPNIVTVERTVDAPAAAVFALIADAANHPVLDGSGSVKSPRSGGQQPLQLGSEFGMSMKRGLPYATKNTVVEYEPNRRIAWRTEAAGPLGRVIGGRVWRYELEPTGSSTRVRETWDVSQDTLRTVLSLTFANRTRQDMMRTLERIDEHLSAQPAT
jgi:uncharacterized protein YndB with AHSA1/START domain